MAIYSWESGNDKPIDRATLKELLIKYKNSALFSSELIDYFEALINNEINYIRDYSTCCSKIDVKLEELNLNFYDQIITSNIYYMILSFFEQYCNIDNVYSKCKDGEFNFKCDDLFLITFLKKIDNSLNNFIRTEINNAAQRKAWRQGRSKIFTDGVPQGFNMLQFNNRPDTSMLKMPKEKTNEEKYIININRYDANESLLGQYKQKLITLLEEAKELDTSDRFFDEAHKQLRKKIYEHFMQAFDFDNGVTYDKIQKMYSLPMFWVQNQILYVTGLNTAKNYMGIWNEFQNKYMTIQEYLEKIDELEKSQSNTYFANEINSAFLEFLGLNENDFKRTSDSIKQEKSSINIGKKLVLTNITNKYLDE